MKTRFLPVERPVATVMVLTSLVVFGAVSALRLPLDFWPMAKEPEVEIRVPFPGAHPLETLRSVVEPLEQELATLDDLESLTASAEEGSAWIDARFDYRSDPDLKLMEVRDAVERARDRMPPEISFIEIAGDVEGGPSSGSVIQGRISADRNLSESWDLLDRRIKRPLERIRGVARVQLDGVEPQTVRIELDLAALRSHAIDVGRVMATINAANLDLDLGAIRDEVVRYDVRTLSRFREIEDLRGLIVGPAGVRLRDVARVELKEPRLTYGRHLDRRFAIGIDVYKEPSANTVEVVDRIMARVGEIERDPALEGIKLLVWNNQGEEIRNSIRGLRNAGIVGGVLAIIVLFLFLRNLRTTAVIGLAIPFSLIVTCGAMYLLGLDLNVLSMLGLMLGVGMMVDNAVVVIENIHRLEGTGVPAGEAARRGAREVALSVTAATATTLFVWSWVITVEHAGMKTQLAAAALPICLAVSCSLLISLTFIPLAASRFPPRQGVKPGRVIRRLQARYRRVLAWTLRHRLVTLTGLLLLAASAVWPALNVDYKPEPQLVDRDVAIAYEVYDAVTKDVLEGYVDRVETALHESRETLGYDALYSVYQEGSGATTRVYLPADEVSGERLARLTDDLREVLPDIPGVKLTLGDRYWWQSSRQPQGLMVPIALHGDDPEYLERIGRRVEERLALVAGVADVRGPSVEGDKELRLIIDAERARELDVAPARIAEAVRLVFRGQSLRRFEGPRGDVELWLGLAEEARPGLDALDGFPIPTDDGRFLPLSSLVRVEEARANPSIFREDRLTSIFVGARFDEGVVATRSEAVERIEQALAGFEMPVGYAWDFGRRGRDFDDSLIVMRNGVALSLLLVILLMAALFESVAQPLAVIVTLPPAFFGAFWGLWLRGFDVDVVSFFGVILLIGVVVNNGIVMINHIKRLRDSGMPRQQALIQGCGDRLRPVLMTSMTTIFGLLPLAMASFAVARVPMASMGTVLIGGLATSMLFTLLGLPVWYTSLEDLFARLRRIASAGVRGATAPARRFGARRLSR